MQWKANQHLFTRDWAVMTRLPQSLTTCFRGYVPTRCSVDFGLVPRGLDTHNRERQLAVDFIASAAGGPTIYLGRDMKMSHKGMGITKADYEAFMRCLSVTLDTFKVPEPERGEVVAFTAGLESDIVEA